VRGVDLKRVKVEKPYMCQVCCKRVGFCGKPCGGESVVFRWESRKGKKQGEQDG
jgi:hypothetical protein